MMTWKKPSPQLIATFDAALASLTGAPAVERRVPGGFPWAYVNGNMFAGLHEEQLAVRLDDSEGSRLRDDFNAKTFEPAPGRPMKGWVVLPPAIRFDAKALRVCMENARRFAATLPPKSKAKAKAKAKAAAKKKTVAKKKTAAKKK